MGHRAWGIGHRAWGIGHGEWGIGHGALGIGEEFVVGKSVFGKELNTSPIKPFVPPLPITAHPSSSHHPFPNAPCPIPHAPCPMPQSPIPNPQSPIMVSLFDSQDSSANKTGTIKRIARANMVSPGQVSLGFTCCKSTTKQQQNMRALKEIATVDIKPNALP
ncbi:hypothetical protein, partial [Aetokthonos hydrillicola]|uniref:hypothetical protein n=1 Tax=Aetokthonos hydrillicola TaxID=1550245 RepID=UPI001ABBD95F